MTGLPGPARFNTPKSRFFDEHGDVVEVDTGANRKFLGDIAAKHCDIENIVGKITDPEAVRPPRRGGYFANLVGQASVLDSVAPCPTVVIGNCVNSDAFRPNLSTSADAMQHLESLTGVRMSADGLRIFVVGSVEYRKGVSIVQRAIPALLELDPRIEFCWLGHYPKDKRDQLSANTKLTGKEFYEPIPAHLRDRVHLSGRLPHRIHHRVDHLNIELSPGTFDDLCRVHLCDWLESVARIDNWGYRGDAYRRLALRLNGPAKTAYDRELSRDHSTEALIG